eukprot:2483016-Prymnesium_polylepis.1
MPLKASEFFKVGFAMARRRDTRTKRPRRAARRAAAAPRRGERASVADEPSGVATWCGHVGVAGCVGR